MSPAGSAILRDVLISNVGKIAYSIDIVPNPVLWNVSNWGKLSENVMLNWSSGLYTTWLVNVSETWLLNSGIGGSQ
jgi:hypothetical protein